MRLLFEGGFYWRLYANDACSNYGIWKQVCHSRAKCIPKGYSFACKCLPGFYGDGKSCQDIDECETLKQCPEHTRCMNTYGKYTCDCIQGYRYDTETKFCTIDSTTALPTADHSTSRSSDTQQASTDDSTEESTNPPKKVHYSDQDVFDNRTDHQSQNNDDGDNQEARKSGSATSAPLLPWPIIGAAGGGLLGIGLLVISLVVIGLLIAVTVFCIKRRSHLPQQPQRGKRNRQRETDDEEEYQPFCSTGD